MSRYPLSRPVFLPSLYESSVRYEACGKDAQELGVREEKTKISEGSAFVIFHRDKSLLLICGDKLINSGLCSSLLGNIPATDPATDTSVSGQVLLFLPFFYQSVLL